MAKTLTLAKGFCGTFSTQISHNPNVQLFSQGRQSKRCHDAQEESDKQDYKNAGSRSRKLQKGKQSQSPTYCPRNGRRSQLPGPGFLPMSQGYSQPTMIDRYLMSSNGYNILKLKSMILVYLMSFVSILKNHITAQWPVSIMACFEGGKCNKSFWVGLVSIYSLSNLNINLLMRRVHIMILVYLTVILF